MSPRLNSLGFVYYILIPLSTFVVVDVSANFITGTPDGCEKLLSEIINVFEDKTNLSSNVAGELSHRYIYFTSILLVLAASLATFWLSYRAMRWSQPAGRTNIPLCTAFLFSVGIVVFQLFLLKDFLPCTYAMLFGFVHDPFDKVQSLQGVVLVTSTLPADVVGWVGLIKHAIAYVAATFAICAVGSLLTRTDDLSDDENPRDLAERMRCLSRVLYAGTALLVTGVFATRAWLGWPAGLLANEEARKPFLSVVDAMTIYWGGAYTIFLLAAYLPAAWALKHRAEELYQFLGAGKGILRDEWFKSHGLALSPAEQFGSVLAVLGPLIAGLISFILSALTGGD